MNIICLAIGKRHDAALASAIEDYSKRINNYAPIKWHIVPSSKANVSSEEQKQLETASLLKQIMPDDTVILLDEGGDIWSSHELSEHLNKCALQGAKRVVFVIGGAYGVAVDLQKRANMVWSLSKLTFPHQLVRLILAEQLYRGFTILRGEPYHHQ